MRTACSPSLCCRPGRGDLPAPPEPHALALLPEETAGLLRSARCVSCSIVLATTTLASSFVAHTAPNPALVVLSAAAQHNIAQAHALSADAAAASAYAAELVLRVADQAAGWAALHPPAPAASSAPALVLATLAQSGAHLKVHGTRALARGLGHPCSADPSACASELGSEIARKVGVVHSGDARAVGRHAPLVRGGQRVSAARMAALFVKDALPPPL